MKSKPLIFRPSSVVKFFNNESDFHFDANEVSTDSRTLTAGNYFIALDGENFDGYKFVDQAIEKKSKVIVYRSNSDRDKSIDKLSGQHKDIIFIGVTDTTTYLGELAKLYISWWKAETGGKCLAICGSNGKTTHKQMLAHLLDCEKRGRVHASKGSFNNSVGVPLTAFKLKKSHELAIFEIGTNHPGEVMALCQIVDPDGGILTNIGFEHMEFFKTLENVFLEERSLYDYLITHKKQEPLILNEDDEWLVKLKDYDPSVFYGEESSDYKIEVSDEKITIQGHETIYEIKNSNIVGSFNFKNLAATFLLAKNYIQDESLLLSSCTSFEPKENRSQLFKHKETLVYLDAYNANPSSMIAALDSFHEVLEKNEINLDQALFILGDMKELGESSAKWHQSVGGHLDLMEAKHCVFVGEYSNEYELGFKQPGIKVLTVDSLEIDLKKYKAAFIKGSRSLHLETILDIVNPNEGS